MKAAPKINKAKILREAGWHAATVVMGEEHAARRSKSITKVVARIHRMLLRLPIKQLEEGAILIKHMKKGYGPAPIMAETLCQMNILRKLSGKGKHTHYEMESNLEELTPLLASKVYIEIFILKLDEDF